MSDPVELAIQRKQRGVDFGLFAGPFESGKMYDEASAFTGYDRIANVRDKDASTSHTGSDRIAPKRGSQCATLLEVYRAYPDGLTDAEAGARSGVPSSWKRSSDLRRTHWIVPTGEVRDGQRVCRAVP